MNYKMPRLKRVWRRSTWSQSKMVTLRPKNLRSSILCGKTKQNEKKKELCITNKTKGKKKAHLRMYNIYTSLFATYVQGQLRFPNQLKQT